MPLNEFNKGILSIFKNTETQREIRDIFKPIIDMFFENIAIYLIFVVLFVLIGFLMNLGTLIILIRYITTNNTNYPNYTNYSN